jgi:hypothetical protein
MGLVSGFYRFDYNECCFHLPCPLYGLAWRELPDEPMLVFLNLARDGRLVVTCVSLAMPKDTNL